MTQQISKYPELLMDLMVQGANVLHSKGIPLPVAVSVAKELAEFFRKHWGGQNFYVPRGVSLDLAERNIEIYSEFNGENLVELCRRHNITKQRLYQILKEVKKGLAEIRDARIKELSNHVESERSSKGNEI